MNKLIYPLVKEGFRASKEYFNFRTETTQQLEAAIAGMFDSDTPTFIVGGVVTEGSGEFDITAGVIAFENKLYHTPGGTLADTSDEYYLHFSEITNADYPQQDHGSTGNVGLLEDVFFERVGTLDKVATDGYLLDDIDRINLVDLSNSVEDNATAIANNASDIVDVTEVKSLVDDSGNSYTDCAKDSFFGINIVTRPETIFMHSFIHLKATAAVSEISFSVPKSNLGIDITDYYMDKITAVSSTNPNFFVSLNINGFGGSNITFTITKESGSFAIDDDCLIKLNMEFLRN